MFDDANLSSVTVNGSKIIAVKNSKHGWEFFKASSFEKLVQPEDFENDNYVYCTIHLTGGATIHCHWEIGAGDVIAELAKRL